MVVTNIGAFAGRPALLSFALRACSVSYPLQIVKGSVEGSTDLNQPSSEAEGNSIGDGQQATAPDLKRAADTALLAFMGAAKGSLYSVTALLEELFSCYRSAPMPTVSVLWLCPQFWTQFSRMLL